MVEHWSKRLIWATRRKNWSYSDLAKYTGISHESIKKYAQGVVRKPRGDIVQRLSKALNVTVKWLQDGVGPDVGAIENQAPIKERVFGSKNFGSKDFGFRDFVSRDFSPSIRKKKDGPPSFLQRKFSIQKNDPTNSIYNTYNNPSMNVPIKTSGHKVSVPSLQMSESYKKRYTHNKCVHQEVSHFANTHYQNSPKNKSEEKSTYTQAPLYCMRRLGSGENKNSFVDFIDMPYSFCQDIFDVPHYLREFDDFFDNKQPFRYVAFLFSGDSMVPTLYSQDLLMIDRKFWRVSGDGLYMMHINGGFCIKRLSVHPLGHFINIACDNNAYTSFESVHAEDLRILGKVAWLGRSLI